MMNCTAVGQPYHLPFTIYHLPFKNMARNFFGNHLDFIGFMASTICAIHCAAVPLILMFGSLGSYAWLANHSIEFGFISISLVLAYWSLWSSYKKHHQNIKALRIVVAGFVILLGSRLLPHALGDGFIVLGGIFVAYAHYVNWRLLQNCKRCCQDQEPVKKVVLMKEDNPSQTIKKMVLQD